jgi:hypothetical protein
MLTLFLTACVGPPSATDGLSCTPSPAPDLVLSGVQGSVGFADQFSGAGDLDGDGYDELVVTTTASGVYVYSGSPTGLSTIPTLVIPHGEDRMYTPVATSVGDVNGDGYDDLGLVRLDVQAQISRLELYLGSDLGPAATPDWTVGGTLEENVGSLAPAGDLDGDGFADLLVGATSGTDEEAGVWIYHGSPSGLDEPEILPYPDMNPTNSLLGVVGDLDGDGGVEIFARSYPYGAPMLYPSSGSSPVSLPAPFRYVRSFVGIPDVTGDGLAELIVSMSDRPETSTVHLFPGSTTYTIGDALSSVESLFAPDGFGFTLAWMVGSPSRAVPVGASGSLEALRVDADGIDSLPEASWISGCGLGIGSGTGDFDGDGQLDLAAIAPDEGPEEIYLFPGASLF